MNKHIVLPFKDLYRIPIFTVHIASFQILNGFGGLEVRVLAFSTQVRGFNPAEAFGFFGRKNPQHAFLRRGSKAVGPMS